MNKKRALLRFFSISAALACAQPRVFAAALASPGAMRAAGYSAAPAGAAAARTFAAPAGPSFIPSLQNIAIAGAPAASAPILAAAAPSAALAAPASPAFSLPAVRFQPSATPAGEAPAARADSELRSAAASGTGEVYDGSEAGRTSTPVVNYGHGWSYAVLKQFRLIHAHRKGLFAGRAEKWHAYASIPAAAGVASFVGFRYMTENLPSVLTSALGKFGAYYLNDFLAPIGFAAAGYLLSLLWSLRDYRKTAPDLRDGNLAGTGTITLPILGTLAAMGYELMQSPAFKAVAGWKMPGTFDPNDLLAYAVGGMAALFMTSFLWTPYANRSGASGPARILPVALAAGAAFVIPRLLAAFSATAGVAAFVVPTLAVAAFLLAGIRALHEAGKHA